MDDEGAIVYSSFHHPPFAIPFLMRLSLFLAAFLLAHSAHAETADEARKELSNTLAAIKESDKRQKDLAQKNGKASGGSCTPCRKKWSRWVRDTKP